MTTLPQTTPMRVPRPAPLAIPGSAPLVTYPQHAAPASAGNMSGADIVRVLRSNALLILIMAVVGSAGGFGLNAWLAANHARYTATGYVRVMTESDLPRPGQIFANESSSGNIDLEAHDQAARLKHPSLVTRVLSNSARIRETQWFQKFARTVNGAQEFDANAAKRELLANLEVVPLPQSRLLSVSFSCGVPSDSRTIVQELVDQHIKDQRQLHQDTETEQSRRIARMKLQYESDLSETQGRMSRIMNELSAGGQPVSGSGSRDIELQTLTAAQVRAQENLIESQSRLSRLQQDLKQTGTSTSIEDAVSQNSRYLLSQSQLDAAISQAGTMRASLGDSNPTVTRLTQEAERLKQRQDALRDELKKSITARLIDELTDSVNNSKSSLASIDRQVHDVQAAIADLAGRRNEFERLRTEEQAAVARLGNLKETQLNFANWDVDSHFANVDWATTPDTPSTPTFPKLPATLAMTVMLSLMLALGIAFLRELSDSSIRSPNDIARVGHLSLLGMIPHGDDDPEALATNLPLTIYESPRSMMAEQFRQVRTRLQHAASLDTTRSILVTGCSPGDGKTTIACNLAAGLALNGRRILLVDANFRRPQLHQLFNLDNKFGFSDVLLAPEALESAVQESPVPNLSVLTLGNRPSNPTELLESQLLIDFIETVLHEYDHVVFDSGPLLIVSETVGLAPRVDGVITVVRAMGDNRGTLQRVRDQLRQLKAEHLGVILNAVRVQGGGYYGPLIKTYYAYQNDTAA